jgi:hypothetical protein
VKERTGTSVSVIGEVLPGPFRITLAYPDGKEEPLEPEGWDHFKSATAG